MKLKSVKKSVLSKWVTLTTNSVEYNNQVEDYHSFELHDYTSIIAINNRKEIVLVEQFRPAVNKTTLELPGGIVESDEGPKKTVIKELFEETGYEIYGDIKLIGKIDVDYGRIKNKAFGYFTKEINSVTNRKNTEGIKTVTMDIDQCLNLALENKFTHSPHLSFLLLAKIKELI